MDAIGGLSSEVRRDLFGRKVVITVSRGARPKEFAAAEKPKKTVPPQKCVFCPGNEHLTPPEIDRHEVGGRWEIRVFPNKFPAFVPESKSAYGRHEVIVETPDHQATLSELSEQNLFDYLSMLQKRMEDALKDPHLAYTCIFKNEGKAAGASLEHSHTQLCGMPFVPAFVKKIAKKKIQRMLSHKRLYVCENESFAAVCPKASRFHFEVWLVPKFEANSLHTIPQERLFHLAKIMKAVLGAVDAATSYSPYNIVYHSAPHGGGAFPFHIQILPRLSTWAGFELATEIVMVSQKPEDSAKILSGLIAGSSGSRH
ncbi:MAG: DUF4921 family protein [Candidatus Micrarchaeota archaeon]|nr:DUF4921 family protein [Candidatus Micrarchaeota archaeon]